MNCGGASQLGSQSGKGPGRDRPRSVVARSARVGRDIGRSDFARGTTAGKALIMRVRTRKPSINASNMEGVVARQHSKSVPIHELIQADDTGRLLPSGISYLSTYSLF